MRNIYKDLDGKLEGNKSRGDLGIGGRINLDQDELECEGMTGIYLVQDVSQVSLRTC
jgi:hypothetical protein